MVQLPLLKDNTKKRSDRNDLPSILNSHSVSTKHIDSQSDSRWKRDPKQSKNQIPIGMSDSFSVARDPHPLTLDNYFISFGCSKATAPESNKTEADIKYVVSSGETHQVSVTYENLSIISKDCIFDPDGYFSPSEIVRSEAVECEGQPSRHLESFKVKTWRKKITTRCDPNLYHNADVKNVIDIEPGNADADSGLQSKAIEDHTVENTIPNALTDLEQSESSFCTTADPRMVKNVTDFKATDINITEASPINITTSRQEPPQVPKASSLSVRRNSMPPNLSQSFNVFAHKGSDRYKVNSNRTNSVLKAKICTKLSQDFIILGKSSIQHQTNKIKNPISRSLGLSCEEAGVSSKFQGRHLQQEKCHFNQKSPKQAFPRISNNSASSGEAIAPFPVRQVHSSVGFLDLKYSDMFKEINSNDKGPGIYEMFGTPVYSREPDEHENRYCRNVHSAPALRCNVSKHKSNHCSGKKSSRIRHVQKRIYPKSHKNPLAIKHTQKVLVSKEATKFEGRCPELDEGVTVSGTEQQIKTDASTAPFHEVVDQQLLVSTEPAKQYEIIPNSNLSPIEEVSLEYTSDVDNTSVHKTFATSVQELLWPEVKVHAKYAPFLICEKDINEPKNPGKDSLMQGKPETTTCLAELEASPVLCYEENQAESSALTFLDRINSALPNVQLKNVSLANIPTKLTCHPVNLVSQTYANIMSYENNTEEITEDIFCYSVAEQLSLDGADGNCSGTVTKNADVETQCRNPENKDDSAANVRNSKNFCLDFVESCDENRFLNVTTFSENSLTNEEPILWTKGEILGKGAYGTVYCGLTSQGHLIAVKQVALNTHDQAGNEKEYQKLQEEVEILKNLTHVNIVGYLGTGLEDNIVSIFMEFVPGGSISSIIRRFGPLSEIVFCKYTKQILEGVAYLHENCVVHRDIKGNNIMLMPNGVIKLIDFGCAKRLVCVSLTNTHSEPLKSVHGTPYWMAPEVINESGYGRKSDIWSTGCTIFEMATGKPPLASMDRIAAMFYIGAHRGLMPSLPKHCSEKADDFVRLCLTRDQRERPTALQLLQHPFIARNS